MDTRKANSTGVAARVASKGQITLPEKVTDALEIHGGDQVVFRIEGDHAVLARTLDLLDLAGSVPVPADKRGVPWEEIRRRTWKARARRSGESLPRHQHSGSTPHGRSA